MITIYGGYEDFKKLVANPANQKFVFYVTDSTGTLCWLYGYNPLYQTWFGTEALSGGVPASLKKDYPLAVELDGTLIEVMNTR